MTFRIPLVAWLLIALLAVPSKAPADESPADAEQTDAASNAAETSEADDTDPSEEETLSPAARRARQRAKQRAEAANKVRYAEFFLRGALPESPGASGPFGELSMNLRKQVARIDQAAKDDRIQGLVLRVREASLGRGALNEVREAIARFRATGKRAIAELEAADATGYLAACACDEIVMPESGFLLLPGVRAEPMFYKGMLAKIGVKADFIHVGEAKGAAEPYTRRSWSDPVKENITALVDDLYKQMVDTISMDRPMKRGRVVEAIDRGLLTAAQALEFGLVDRLAYSAALRGELEQLHETDKVAFVRNYGKSRIDTDFSGPAGVFKLLGLMAGGNANRTKSGDKLAIVYAVGPIVTGKSEVDPFGSVESVGSTTIVEALNDAADDDRVKAIVLRVNSPGGSALASDLIWQAIQSIDKPVVASMGDVAASGGYYISMGCDQVFAEPTTVTGSIGVVGGKMAIGGLLDKIGVTTDLVARGANSGLFSLTNKFSDSERAVLQSLMDDTYDQFTAKAAAGRNLTQDRVKQLGGGKVYTGRQAERLELIDQLGDLRAAVAKAKAMAGLDEDEKLRIVTYPEPVDFFDSLFGDNEDQREVRLRVDLGDLAPEFEAVAQRVRWLRTVFGREPIGLVMPYDLRIE